MDQLVLAIAKIAHGLLLRRCIRFALGQDNASRRQEAPHPIETRFAIHVLWVVATDIKGLKGRLRANFRYVRIRLGFGDDHEVSD
jgi:hypothetical protein